MNRHRAGFTLVEVLAALTIAALMMVVVLQALHVLALRGREIRHASRNSHWQSVFDHHVRWDIVNSKSMMLDRNGLVLSGFASRDFSTDRPTFSPAEIRYDVIQRGSHHLLARREACADEFGVRSFREELACDGIIGIDVRLANGDLLSRTLHSNVPIPPRLTVVFQKVGPASGTIEHECILE